MSRWRQFLTSDDGTTAVEYAVVLAMIIMACIIGITAFGGSAGNKWGKVEGELNAHW